MKPINDQKTQHLVALAKEGNQPALNQLCSVYGERVRRIIRFRLDTKLRPKLDSIDLVQDALILALGGLKDFTYRNEGDFLRWLSKIAENKLHDVLKKYHADKRDIRKEISFKQEGSSTEGWFYGATEPMGTTTPSVIMRKKEALDRLEKALNTLKPEYKEVIVLKRIEGLSHAEIAERLSKSTNAVPMLLFRAMAALTIAYGKD
ncbi:MAG: sigma-70 family RNA polymerase sigma factor [Planctomycetes bacterium]|nr:sigma-70 family RNA polymerase sigma factor [Planctomycetota bacterium]MBL7144808.1 sigma-70 family RNA polymerase sigma factor [Phycisphaerae bacterium]